MGEIILHDYWRSSASYRVRIALNLKGIDYSTNSVDLLSGRHKAPDHLKRQPQGIVPAIDIDGTTLSQSLSIIEYLDETRPQVPLLPDDVIGRTRVRALSCAIAMEIHPVCNLSVVRHVESLAGDETIIKWMQNFIHSVHFWAGQQKECPISCSCFLRPSLDIKAICGFCIKHCQTVLINAIMGESKIKSGLAASLPAQSGDRDVCSDRYHRN